MATDEEVNAAVMKGMKLEEQARRAYAEAWQLASDDFQRCTVAHFVARLEHTPKDKLRWNLDALAHAKATPEERVRNFWASLYFNAGIAYDLMRQGDKARECYEEAVQHLPAVAEGGYKEMLEGALREALERSSPRRR